MDVIEAKLARQARLSSHQILQVRDLLDLHATDMSIIASVRLLGVADPMLDQGLLELEIVLEECFKFSNTRFWVEADLRIARGLDYYTGTVFETRMAGYDRLGSVCSGGRYDSLATDGKTTYPGVGISLGVTRMLVPLFQSGRLSGSRSVPTVVLVVIESEDDRRRCEEIARDLRARDIAAEIAEPSRRFDSHLKYAKRRGIPFAWLPGVGLELDRVRDIRDGSYELAESTKWSPRDSRDLWPQPMNLEDDQ